MPFHGLTRHQGTVVIHHAIDLRNFRTARGGTSRRHNDANPGLRSTSLFRRAMVLSVLRNVPSKSKTALIVGVANPILSHSHTSGARKFAKRIH